MRKLLIALLATSTLYVQGCAGIFGGVEADTPRKTVVQMYGALEAAYNTYTNRYVKGLITATEFARAVSTINRADGYVDMARDAALAGNGAQSDEYLALAQSVLDELERAAQ